MTKEVEDQEKVNGFRIFGMVLPSLPSLMLKFGGIFLRFKREAKKGGRTFQRELVNQGRDETTAAQLTEIYLESSNIANYISLFRENQVFTPLF